MWRILLFGLLAGCAGAQPVFTIYSRTLDTRDIAGQSDFGVAATTRVLMDELCKVNGCEPAENDLAAVRDKFARTRTASLESNDVIVSSLMMTGLSREQARQRALDQQREMDQRWALAVVSNFKFNQVLWRRHGGRVVLLAFGFPVAADALLKEVTLLERQGALRFQQSKLRDEFNRYFTSYRGDGVVTGERAREVFGTPIWEQR